MDAEDLLFAFGCWLIEQLPFVQNPLRNSFLLLLFLGFLVRQTRIMEWLRPKPIVRKWFIPSIPKTAMGFVVFSTLATVAKRGTDVPSDRSEWQELVIKRSRSLFSLRGRSRFLSGDLLRLSIGKSSASDGPGVQARFAPRKSAMLELLQGLAHMRGGVIWILQASVKGPGLPSDLSRYKKLRIPRAKFLCKIQFSRGLSRRLNHKLAARTLLGERIAAHARPVLATKRNTGKFATATRTKVAVTGFPRLSLVFLRDWCISAKLIANGNASRLSDSEAFFIRVLVLPQPVKVEVLGRMA